MGAGFSEEDADKVKAPQCDARYLHWLLSDPMRVNEAFKPVWSTCDAEDDGVAPKASVLEVLQRVIAEFERSADPPGTDVLTGGSKTARQLAQIVMGLPESLTRAEALHLFSTALLSLQAVLVMKSGTFALLSWPQNDGQRRNSIHSNGQPGGTAPPIPPKQTYSSRSVAKAEDPPVFDAAKHRPRFPAQLAAQFRSSQTLPSRQELESENEQLQRLSEVIAERSLEERQTVLLLEEELRAMEDTTSQKHGHPATEYGIEFAMVEATARDTEDEVSRLEAAISVRDSEVAACEERVLLQQGDIQQLLGRRSHEEAVADELGREARDLALEFKSCRRSCGNLESEIALEETRAAALREAFEGRRARFTTAETAARNAELSTMRATRRRSAAESAARRESQAVEECRQERSAAASQTAYRIETLTAELAEVRTRGAQSQTHLGTLNAAAGRRAAASAQASAEAASSLRAIRAELAQAEAERDGEVAAAHASAGEVAELEVSRARLEGQLAGLEGELRSAQRAQAGGLTFLEDEVDPNADLLTVESRMAEVQRAQARLQGELQAAGGPEDDRKATEAAWQRALAAGAELGEARSALARRRAQRSAGPGAGESVVAVLRQALRDAEAGERRSAAELAELRAEAGGASAPGSSVAAFSSAASAARCAALRRRIAAVEEEITGGAAARSAVGGATDGQVLSLRRQVNTLEEELDQREGVLLGLDRMVAERRVGAAGAYRNPPAG